MACTQYQEIIFLKTKHHKSGPIWYQYTEEKGASHTKTIQIDKYHYS